MPRNVLGLSVNRDFYRKCLLPFVSQHFFPKRQKRLLSYASLRLCGHAVMGVLGGRAFLQAASWVLKAGSPWEVPGSSLGFFLSSVKASASCSKFLITTFHLKSPLVLKEANFNSTVSQDNLARKQSDDFKFLYFLRWGNWVWKQWNEEQKEKSIPQSWWNITKAVWRDACWVTFGF